MYALCRCLAEKRPVIWKYKKELFLFVEEGTFLVPRGDVLRCAFNTVVWTLVDSEMEGVPLAQLMYSDGMSLFIIYAAFRVMSKRIGWACEGVRALT
jgi:hypothetical protein